MSQLDAKKESISFLTKLFFVLVGVILATIAGLVSMIKNQDVSFVFWLGVMTVVALSVGCLLVFKNIKRTIKEIERL